MAILRLYAALPKSTEAQVLGKQALRSGTSVRAHYMESIRSRFNAEVVSKPEGALRELEETRYWLELPAESGTVKSEHLDGIVREADELTAILVTCAKKVKARPQ